MKLNDALVLMTPPVLPTPYTRLLTYATDIGLSTQQVMSVIGVLRTWRTQCVSHSKLLHAKKSQIEALGDARPADLPAIKQRCDEYSGLLNVALKSFGGVVAQVNALLTTQQLDTLQAIYESEKAEAPLLHPGYM